MSKLTLTFLGTTMLLGAASLCGCQAQHPITMSATSAPRHEVPGAEWWHYQFAYFPGQQVYFEPYTATYFWYDQGLWEEGPDLPESITLRSGDAVIVRLQNQKPYIQHSTVCAWHPCYYGPLPGSMAPYHATTDAVAQSELRAAIRMASTLEELVELSANQSPDITEITGTSTGAGTSNPTGPNAGSTSPAADASTTSTSSMISGASEESSTPTDQ
jgi:hypothetical protein